MLLCALFMFLNLCNILTCKLIFKCLLLYDIRMFVINELSLIRANIKEKCLCIHFGIKWAINIVHSKFEIDVEKTVKQS